MTAKYPGYISREAAIARLSEDFEKSDLPDIELELDSSGRGKVIINGIPLPVLSISIDAATDQIPLATVAFHCRVNSQRK